MIYLLLAYEFFKIGLFSYGGGYATIPFLYDIAIKHGWYSVRELTSMTAVASMTPGPVGINAATYAGIKTAGIAGALTATIMEVIPSLIFVILISKLLKNLSNNFYVKSLIDTLTPISCALLTSVAIGMLRPELGDLKVLLLLGFMLLLSWNTKKDPIFYILLGGVAGIINTIIHIA